MVVCTGTIVLFQTSLELSKRDSLREVSLEYIKSTINDTSTDEILCCKNAPSNEVFQNKDCDDASLQDFGEFVHYKRSRNAHYGIHHDFAENSQCFALEDNQNCAVIFNSGNEYQKELGAYEKEKTVLNEMMTKHFLDSKERSFLLFMRAFIGKFSF